MPEPQTNDAADVVKMFQGLPRERQAALLGRMTPDQKLKLNKALDMHLGAPTPPAAAPAPGGYGSEILGAVKRGFSALKQAPQALLNPPDTHYTPAELEKKLPIIPKILFNIPATMANAVENAEAERVRAGQAGEGWAGQALAYLKQLPVVGDITRAVEPAGSGKPLIGPLNYNVSPQNIGGAVEGAVLAEAPKVAVEGTLGGLSKVGKLRETTRAIAQGKVGSSAFETTDKIVDKYNQDAEAAKTAQAEADLKVGQKNVEAEQAAREQTAKIQGKTTAKNEAAMNTADIATEEQNVATAEANRRATEAHQRQSAQVAEINRRAAEAHQQTTQEIQAHNENVGTLRNQAATLDSQLREGSEQLGSDVSSLDKKLRAEGNQKYASVREKVGDDPGVPTATISEAAVQAKNLLKGAPESIRQFNDLIRKGVEEEEGAVVNGMAPQPGTGLYALMEEQGLLGEEKTLPFDQLQGYSSELGRKLAEEKIPGDVRQAVKFLKEKIDAAKMEVAERNGAGLDIREADAFWNKYLDAFYDKDSAVANVRRRVGVQDPEFYSEPFTKGKSAGVGAAKLRGIPSQYADLINQVASNTERLRNAYSQRGGMKIPSEKTLPTAPEAKASPTAPTAKATPPRAMGVLQPIPEPVAPEVTPPVRVPGPKTPTVGEIMENKGERARTQAFGMGRGSKYDIVTLAGAAYALSQGHLWTAAAVPAIRFGVPALLKSDGFIKFVSQPGEADLAAAARLPQPARGELIKNLKLVIEQNKASHTPMKVSPSITRFLQTAGAGGAASAVHNPREAREALGRPTP